MSEPITPIIVDTARPVGSRSFPLLVAAAASAAVAAIVNVAGLLGFPPNAPVEFVFAVGITLDLVAIAVALGVAAVGARRARLVSARSIPAIVGSGLAVGALVLALLGGGLDGAVQLAAGTGRYMDAAGGVFFGGVLWVLAAVFGATGYRRGGSPTNVFALVALALPGLLVAWAVASSVLYGLGLTD